jgi:uncharacterized protein YkwD
MTGIAAAGYHELMLAVRLLVLLVACSQSGEEPVGRLERRMAELVNAEREARGIAPLSFSSELSGVARRYSAKMAERGEIHHELDRPMDERVRAVRPDTCRFGENVSKHTSIDYSMGDLMLSPGHRANILDENFKEIGVGIVRGEDGFLYITQEFVSPCPKRAFAASRARG